MKIRIISVILAVTIICSVSGCANTESTVSSVQEQTTVSDVGIVESEEPVIEGKEEEPDEVKIYDFYEYALAGWLKDVKIDPELMTADVGDSYEDEVFANVSELVTGLNIEDYDENSGLYKLLSFYKQLRDESLQEKSVERIKSMVNKIESANTLEAFFDLITEPEYMGMDYLFARDYFYIDSANYSVQFMAVPYMKKYHLSDEEEAFLTKEITNQYLLLGFSEEEASARAKSAIEFNNKIILASNVLDDDLILYSEEKYLAEEHAVPLMNFLRKMGYSKLDYLNHDSYEFIIYKSNLDFYDTVVNKENLEQIKDFYVANMLRFLFDLGNTQMKESSVRITRGLNGYSLSEIDNEVFLDNEADVIEYDMGLLLNGADTGLIARLYRDKYLSQDIYDEINTMADLIKDKFVEKIKASDWMSDRLKEKLSIKIKKINIYIGRYDDNSDYEDVVIGEDPVATMLSFSTSNREFNKRFLRAESVYMKTTMGLYISNGQYVNDCNSVFIPLGTIQYLVDNKDASFEEKFGFFGSTLSHEIAHAISPYHITNGVDGVFMDFISDAEYDTVWKSFDLVAEMIDGVKTSSGNTYNPGQCANELFADLLSLDCSLDILNDMEKPDYDTFFLNYAKSLGYEMLPNYEKYVVTVDNHILGRERTNLVMYQFDKFYETYVIDEANEWYVPFEKRFKGYVAE